jgi:EmrB/QacA subfamily drug resistance transporter
MTSAHRSDKVSKNVTIINKSLFASPYYVLVVLLLGDFMMGLDALVFAPALVPLVKNLHTTFDLAAWVTIIYILLSTAIMPLAGKMSDIFGRKRVFILGVCLFTLGSLLSSLSWNIYALIVFRAAQALGGGIIMPTAFAAIGSMAPPDKIGKMMGILGSMSALTMIIGPNIGGFVVENFGWRAVFYINLPIGVLTILMALAFRENYGNVSHHIDVIGSILLGLGLGALLLFVNQLGSNPLTDITVFPFVLFALLLGVALYWYEKQTEEPILDMTLIFRGDILSINLASMMVFIGLMCSLGFTATFAQVVLGLSVQDSGTILTPVSLTMFLMSLAGGILLDRVGFRPMMITGGVITAVGLAGMAILVNSSISLIADLVVIGIGAGVGINAIQVALVSVTPRNEKGASMGINATFKGIGMMIAPITGGYLLSEGMKGIIAYRQAFTYLFGVGALTTIIAVGLILYFIARFRKTAVPIIPPAIQQ